MSSRQSLLRGPLVACGLAFAFLLGAASLSWRLDRYHRQEGAARYQVPKADVMQAIATGYDNLLADAFWLQFLQYDGEKVSEPLATRRFEHLGAGLSLITTLDPHFQEAYLFGSWVLGDAGDPLAAEHLLLSAIARDRRYPDYGPLPHYYFQLGFIRFLYLHQYAAAAEAFRECARLAQRPPHQDSLLAIAGLRMTAGMAQRGHETALAIKVWHTLLTQAQKTHDQRMASIARHALVNLEKPAPRSDPGPARRPALP